MEETFKAFRKTDNIDVSQKEKDQENNELQRTKAQAEREKTTARSFYNSLPQDACIGNQQLCEVETFQE